MTVKEVTREIDDSGLASPTLTVRVAIPDGEGGVIEAEGKMRMGTGRAWVKARHTAVTFARNALDSSHRWTCRCRYCGHAAQTEPDRDRYDELCSECSHNPENRPGWPSGDADLAVMADSADTLD